MRIVITICIRIVESRCVEKSCPVRSVGIHGHGNRYRSTCSRAKASNIPRVEIPVVVVVVWVRADKGCILRYRVIHDNAGCPASSGVFIGKRVDKGITRIRLALVDGLTERHYRSRYSNIHGVAFLRVRVPIGIVVVQRHAVREDSTIRSSDIDSYNNGYRSAAVRANIADAPDVRVSLNIIVGGIGGFECRVLWDCVFDHNACGLSASSVLIFNRVCNGIAWVGGTDIRGLADRHYRSRDRNVHTVGLIGNRVPIGIVIAQNDGVCQDCTIRSSDIDLNGNQNGPAITCSDIANLPCVDVSALRRIVRIRIDECGLRWNRVHYRHVGGIACPCVLIRNCVLYVITGIGRGHIRNLVYGHDRCSDCHIHTVVLFRLLIAVVVLIVQNDEVGHHGLIWGTCIHCHVDVDVPSNARTDGPYFPRVRVSALGCVCGIGILERGLWGYRVLDNDISGRSCSRVRVRDSVHDDIARIGVFHVGHLCHGHDRGRCERYRKV